MRLTSLRRNVPARGGAGLPNPIIRRSIYTFDFIGQKNVVRNQQNRYGVSLACYDQN